MKQLIWKLALPLTIIVFIVFSKWWHALLDGPDAILYGFHTSMSLQFFFIELLIDLLAYFLFFFMVIYLTNRFLFPIKIPKTVSIILYVMACILLCLPILIAVNPDNVFYMKRPFDIEVIDSGYDFIWQDQDWRRQ